MSNLKAFLPIVFELIEFRCFKMPVKPISDIVNVFQTMDPGQDLLLAALSESGICPNDLFDIDSQDTVQSSASQQVNKSI